MRTVLCALLCLVAAAAVCADESPEAAARPVVGYRCVKGGHVSYEESSSDPSCSPVTQSNPAFAPPTVQGWRRLLTSTDNVTTIWTYDERTLREAGSATGMLMIISMEPLPVPGGTGVTYLKSVARIRADCKQHTAKILEETLMDSSDIDGGRVVRAAISEHPIAVVPNTMQDIGITALCTPAP
jgi:hypothetical protein